jgi:hypothetical protein
MNFLVWLSNSAPAVWARESDSIWGYPTILFLHTLGLGVLVGFTTAIDFRVLGFAASVPLTSMGRLFRLIWLGFWINAASGTALLIMSPAKVSNPAFVVKMALIVLGVGNMWLLKRRLSRADADVSTTSGMGRFLAATSLLLWAGATAAGRLMAYVGTAR